MAEIDIPAPGAGSARDDGFVRVADPKEDAYGRPLIQPLSMPTPIRSIEAAEAWIDALTKAVAWLRDDAWQESNDVG